MTIEEAESLERGDTVTRNGEAGTVQAFSDAGTMQGLKVHVEWPGGRLGMVGYRELERA
jgi:hypothetical protein